MFPEGANVMAQYGEEGRDSIKKGMRRRSRTEKNPQDHADENRSEEMIDISEEVPYGSTETTGEVGKPPRRQKPKS